MAQDIEVDECLARCTRLGYGVFFEREEQISLPTSIRKAEEIALANTKTLRKKSELTALSELLSSAVETVSDKLKRTR